MTVAREREGPRDEAPFVAGTLRGYRTWRPLGRWSKVEDGALPLTSVTQPQIVWTPSMTARCIPPDAFSFRCPPPDVPAGHDSPSVRCSCGIYAWYDPRDTYIVRGRIFGVVQAYGRILMGDRGFRAEHARLVAIVTRSRRIAAACASADVAVYRRRRELLHDYPSEDLTALLGERPTRRRGPPIPPLAGRGGSALMYAIWGSALPPGWSGDPGAPPSEGADPPEPPP